MGFWATDCCALFGARTTFDWGETAADNMTAHACGTRTIPSFVAQTSMLVQTVISTRAHFCANSRHLDAGSLSTRIATSHIPCPGRPTWRHCITTGCVTVRQQPLSQDCNGAQPRLTGPDPMPTQN
ncbi:hypothetical protein IG631_07955 [Alternaria alternata]|nr:hypothetical protein IG631_07955 [Alternaria alternata]